MEAELQLPHMITLNLSEQLDASTYLKVDLTEDTDWKITCALPRLDQVLLLSLEWRGAQG